MTKKYVGRCACGTCTFEFNTEPPFVAVCHRLDCKRASGAEAATFMGVPTDDFALTSGQPKSYGYGANSGQKLYRNFCPACGARIFTDRLESFPGMVFVQLGAVERPDLIEPKLEMFSKRRLPWVRPLDLQSLRHAALAAPGSATHCHLRRCGDQAAVLESEARFEVDRNQSCDIFVIATVGDGSQRSVSTHT